MPEPAPSEADPTPGRGARPWLVQTVGLTVEQIIGAVVVLLAIASVISMSARLSSQQAEIDSASASIQCQTAYNAQTISATNAGRQAALIERNANRAVLEQGLSRRLDPSAFDTWTTEVKRADDLRSANPYPERPNCEAP